MDARRQGQDGALAPLWKCCKVFLCISTYSKTLSGRIIYALFSQPVVGLWGLSSQTPTWAPSLDPAGDFRSQTPNLLTPGKHLAGAHAPPHKTGEHPPAKFLVASHYRASRNSTK